MDQLRQVLGWLKQQHFWVLSVLIAIVSVACWWSASGTLRSEFEVKQKAITSEITNVSSVRNKPFLPNETINQKQEAETKKQSEEVAKTWRVLYDRQREHVLEWPEQLSPEFRSKVEKLQFGDEIEPQYLRDNYQNYAVRYFPELPKIIGARVMCEEEMGTMEAGGGGYGRGEGGGYGYGGGRSMGGETIYGLEDDNDYVCEWLDQSIVRQELEFPQRPSSIRIWVTQEDLWVYKTLLNVIKNTNEAANATRKSNAAVRVVHGLEVGQRAANYSHAPGRIYKVPMAAVAVDPSMAGMEGGMMPAEGGVAGGEGAYSGYDGRGGGEAGMVEGGGGYGGYGRSGEGPATPEQERAKLLSGRYLDETGKPISAGGGMDPSLGGGEMAAADPSAGAAAATASPSEFGREYKRLPVRMSLEMDQRWLTYLIAQCANQPLPVEVQEVRINPTDFGTMSEGGMGYSGGGYGRGGYGGGREGGIRGGYEGGFAGGGAGASLFPERIGIQSFSAQPHIAKVVIQGIIYIYNEPDPSVVGTGQDAAVAMAPQ